MTSIPPGTTLDAVAEAKDSIPAELYHGPDGNAVPQAPPPHVAVRNIRALDLHRGMRVLEIGTGTGYSAALMGRIVGRTGSVLTIDDNPRLCERAGGLFAQHGHNAIAAVGNGLAGHPGGAPYDRIVVSGTPAAIPAAWLDQLAVDGTLVTGCLVSDLPGSYAVAHILKKADGGSRVTVHAGRYAHMGVPSAPPNITVVAAEDNARYFLATASTNRAMAQQLLAGLRAADADPWPGIPGEYLDLKNWLLARRPRGLFTAATEYGEGIGLGIQAEFDLGDTVRHFDVPPEAAMVTPAHLVASPPGSPTAARLLDLLREWRDEECPSSDTLDAVLRREGRTYQVRLDD